MVTEPSLPLAHLTLTAIPACTEAEPLSASPSSQWYRLSNLLLWACGTSARFTARSSIDYSIFSCWTFRFGCMREKQALQSSTLMIYGRCLFVWEMSSCTKTWTKAITIFQRGQRALSFLLHFCFCQYCEQSHVCTDVQKNQKLFL